MYLDVQSIGIVNCKVASRGLDRFAQGNILHVVTSWKTISLECLEFRQRRLFVDFSLEGRMMIFKNVSR